MVVNAGNEKKLSERRLPWYGHAIGTGENSLAYIDFKIKVDRNDPKLNRNMDDLIR